MSRSRIFLPDRWGEGYDHGVLCLQNVRKSLGGREVLRPLSASVPAGQILVVLGPSGCGKSTLIRLITGLLQPDEGEITVDGQRVEESSLQALRQQMGYVIQGGGLFPHLTARQNVELLARHLQSTSEARVEELRELTRFPAEAMNRFPGELSGGQRQRVSLMRALYLQPKLLLLDEPLGALDPMIRFELQEDLSRIIRSLQMTVVLVTHDLGEAAFFADDVILMRDGAIAQQGAFVDLVERPAEPFVEAFVRAQRADWMGKS